MCFKCCCCLSSLSNQGALSGIGARARVKDYQDGCVDLSKTIVVFKILDQCDYNAHLLQRKDTLTSAVII
eukprot:3973934-Amphidinium_carterae.1